MRGVNQTRIDGRYTIERLLGSGGMAEVFLAHDGVLDRDVALKVLRSQYAGDEEFYERFRGEALWAAHERGVIHRDIKPQNILVTDMGHLKVTDFGIARAASAATISATNAVFGTAGYLSPEQALGEPATPRSDLYSLGIVLYELLTGVVPYRADNPVAVCMKHVTEPLTPPRRLDPTIPEAVDALVVKMLAKDPADRPASASELLDDIETVRKGVPPTAPTPRTGTPRLGVRKTAGATAGAVAGTTAGATMAANETTAGGAHRRRRRTAVVLLCVLFALALLGAATLGLSRGAQDGTPLGRVQGVAGEGLDAPTADAGGPGEAGAGSDVPDPPPAQPPASTPPAASPPPSSPPAASPPASAPPDGPADDQYDGG